MTAKENQSLARFISVMDCFNGPKHKLGIQEVSDVTGLPYSTTGRILQNLLSEGLLNQDTRTKEYYLGVKVLTWAGSYLNKVDLIEVAEPFLLDLFDATKETISLYILDHHERICIYRKESPHSIRMVARIGERMPLHLGAAGKLFLLQFGKEEKSQYYRECNLSEADIQKLESTLLTIKQNGYSVTFGERVADSAAVAAPIFDFQKKVAGVINISGPISRFSEELVDEFVRQIMDASRRISFELGYLQEK